MIVSNRAKSSAPASMLGIRETGSRWPLVITLLLVLLSHLLPPGVLTALMLLVVVTAFINWTFSRQPFPEPLGMLLAPLFWILLTGAYGVWNHELYDFGKGAWYVANVGLVLTTGYVLGRSTNNLASIIRIITIAGLIVSLSHLLVFAVRPELLALSAEDVRRGPTGRGFMISAIAVALCVSALLKQLPIFGSSRSSVWLVLFICLASLVLSFSRSWYLTALILIVASFGLFDPRRIGLAIVLVVIGFMAFAAYSYGVIEFLDVDPKSVFYKLARVPLELYPQEYFSRADIYINWRGYETARAFHTYWQGNPLQWLFGQGLGANVDLGLYLNLGDFYSREAPVLHNGYMQLLVWTGVLGVFFYLLLMWRIFRRGILLVKSGSSQEAVFSGRWLIGLAIVFLLTTVSIAGMLNKSSFFVGIFIIGALFSYDPSQLSKPNATQRLKDNLNA